MRNIPQGTNPRKKKLKKDRYLKTDITIVNEIQIMSRNK